LAVNINISNYEEFLLSAIDGELTGEEMAALEVFLQQYPTIRKELALLESTRLVPDTDMKFDAKDTLYRREDILSVDNYQRFLLDYVDNELNASERIMLEKLIIQHPHIGQELAILQAARLTPDLSVTFENKASLYRKERTRIRPLWWWGAAAAVVAGLTFWLIPAKQSEESAQIAVNQPNMKSSTQAAQQVGTPAISTPQATVPAIADADNPVVRKTQPVGNAAETAVRKLPAEKDANTAASAALANNATVGKAANRPAGITDEPKQQEPAAHIPDNRVVALAKIPQPASTSGEVVQQLQAKSEEQEKILAENAAELKEKSAAMANATKMNSAVPAIATSAPANVKGELVVAVTMNGDSKLLNGVANVARFLSRKKK
jgi:hypothetical protein